MLNIYVDTNNEYLFLDQRISILEIIASKLESDSPYMVKLMWTLRQ